ncbi:MAG: hypothetical protein ACETVY_03795 [Candidatus Bathyarchaeia archaeon]
MIRSSSGITRRKGQSGRAVVVECAICGAKVPKTKQWRSAASPCS